MATWPTNDVRFGRNRFQVDPGVITQTTGSGIVYAVNIYEPKWIIHTDVDPKFNQDDLATFLDDVAGEVIEIPTFKPVPAHGTWAVTAISLVDGSVRVDISVRAGVDNPIVGHFVRVGTADRKRLYRVTRVSGQQLMLKPGSLPVAGSNQLVLGDVVSVRMLNPAGVTWGEQQGWNRNGNLMSGATIEWVEVY